MIYALLIAETNKKEYTFLTYPDKEAILSMGYTLKNVMNW